MCLANPSCKQCGGCKALKEVGIEKQEKKVSHNKNNRKKS